MYIFKQNQNVKINQTKASEIIGITQPNLSKILNGKLKCRKVTAYSITKYIDNNLEIEDLFDKVEVENNER